MKNEFTIPSSDGITQLHVTEWVPEGEIRGILQISHGMVEYVGRQGYAQFAEFLNERGYYVVGNDHLGHGGSVVDESKLGYFAKENGNACVIADLHAVRTVTEKKYPGAPYFLLGHSMGSFLARQYAELHGEGLSGVIIMGTGSQPEGMLPIPMALCKIIAAFKGWEYRSELMTSLATGGYNKQFAPNRTRADWITRDEAIVDVYCADPYCSFTFTLNAYYNMFKGIQFIQRKENIARIPKDLPLLLVSGAEDPVGENGKGVRTAYEAFRAAGIRNVEMRLYDGARHEILNELQKETVREELYDWMERVKK